MNTHLPLNGLVKAAALSIMLLALAGCPADPDLEYQRGLVAGFMEDDEYWLGYWDSYDTVPDGPILYSGSEIPYVEEPPYEAGYWDGVWYAYNDGFFVCYDYAFTIGFSEGYDVGYRHNWYAFLRYDEHLEYLDGSFEDGYNDGFSEGSIFGASDYEEGLAFDWFDAMWDYRDGTDLYIEELGRGTGEWGPVWLYEYGVDPHDFYKKSEAPSGASPVRRPRPDTLKSADAARPRSLHVVATAETKELEAEYDPNEISYRSFTDEARNSLEVAPERSNRVEDEEFENLSDTWLDRVNRYRNSLGE